MIKETAEGVLFNIKVVPNSSKNCFFKENDFYKLKITAQPIENKANKAVIERQEFEFNLYLKDELFPLTEDTFTLTTKIGGQPFTKSYYVLNLANTYGGTPV